MKRTILKHCKCGTRIGLQQTECFLCRRGSAIQKRLSVDVLPDSVPKLLKKHIPLISSRNDLEFNKEVSGGSFYLHGPAGAGKSHQAALYLSLLLKSSNKYHGEWINIPKFLFDLRQLYSRKDIPREQSEEALVEKYSKVPYLVLDDLGVEKTSDWANLILYLIINERYENERPVIITSNLSVEELGEKMGDDRIPSRIMGMCEVVEINREDRRRK